mmetsp:Transcript_13721/g.26571  ORF Transcript_13721/g.26571 Transcript_13721/m.26571 type:complete len:462 (+) Transcript_13721:357-1742(+)|eukprot:CAMPEP_0171532582 /NCGR_PEP_ID=MMETSP0959-20130129/14942_1 /TAXON_ID=87120 /ORGANISM="Aurantiochytrium limacinum, Strain ATCCMYA-1381" /LENGTH=461 /DNA_ID=CAMNT_0012076959 /DNA_START=275 /DNA_END=1660 /DNA_ORIENTATION=+
MDIQAFNSHEGDEVNEYKLGRLLGEGTFGEVREGRKGNQVFAVKCLSRSFLRKKREYTKEGRRMKIKTALDDVQREIAIMKKVHHPNLVGLVEAIDNEDTDNLYIVLEFVSGGQVMYWDGKATQYHRKSGGIYSEDEARPLARDVLEGLRYLHAQDIIHRDLKPENLLLTSEGRVKIGDFGIAQKLEMEKTKSASLSNMQGTYQFMAPEMITESKYNGYLIDIWAFGVCLYAFVNGALPFYGSDPDSVFASIENNEVVIPENLSDQLKEALGGILEKDPSKRMQMEDILSCAWFDFSSVGGVDESPNKIELTEDDELNAITPFKLDIVKIVKAKGAAKKWRKAASSSRGMRTEDGSTTSIRQSEQSEMSLASEHPPMLEGDETSHEASMVKVEMDSEPEPLLMDATKQATTSDAGNGGANGKAPATMQIPAAAAPPTASTATNQPPSPTEEHQKCNCCTLS